MSFRLPGLGIHGEQDARRAGARRHQRVVQPQVLGVRVGHRFAVRADGLVVGLAEALSTPGNRLDCGVAAAGPSTYVPSRSVSSAFSDETFRPGGNLTTSRVAPVSTLVAYTVAGACHDGCV